MISLICPNTRKPLVLSADGLNWNSEDGTISYPVNENVVRFLQQQDQFYEGAYLNRIRFLPRSEHWWHIWPLWMISNGYLWEVRKQFEKGSKILELGCASGVDYFGKRYEMIGLDLSFQSLKGLVNYKAALQADATELPLPDHSLDGIISSYFWEHIPPAVKDKMLAEFFRVLKPGGKLVFLYDVETDNWMINQIKKKDLSLYNKLFLEGDGHFGYEKPDENRKRFEKANLKVLNHFGMERSCLQSNSVFEKIRHVDGFIGISGKVGYLISKGKIVSYLHMFCVRVFDETLGHIWPNKNSRIILTTAEKR